MDDSQYCYVYILRCSDGSDYVGFAEDLEQRLRVHSDGRASPCTAKRLPVELLYSEKHESIESARRREPQLKRWTIKKKEALCRGDLQELKKMSKRRIS